MKNIDTDNLRQEYSKDILGKGVRGKYYQDYNQSTNLVLLNPEVAEVFKDEKAVNDALMSLIELAKKTVK